MEMSRSNGGGLVPAGFDPSHPRQQIKRAWQAFAGSGEQVEGCGFEAWAINADLMEGMVKIEGDLLAIQWRETEGGADAGIQGPLRLEPEGVEEIGIADEDQGEDRTAREIQPEQEADFFKRPRAVDLGFVKHEDWEEAVELTQCLFEQDEVNRAAVFWCLADLG